MAETDGTRKISSSEWEDIDIKPPIDLIPDEFVRETNGNVLVELVCGEDDYEAKEFKQTLENLGFTVNETCKERQKMDKTVDDEWISKVLEKTAIQEYDGLIMIFAKVVYRNDDMKNIWSKFTAKTCPKLKNKPKIFIFQILKKSAEYDNTAISLNWLAAYDTPAEADILIIYDRYDLGDLMTILNENTKQYGLQEDIIHLATINSGLHCSPMIISTMTRKFFFGLHEHRSYHHRVLEKHDLVQEKIKQLKRPPVNKKNKRTSFRGFPSTSGHSSKKEETKSPEVYKEGTKSSTAKRQLNDKSIVSNSVTDSFSVVRNSSITVKQDSTSSADVIMRNLPTRRSGRKTSTSSFTSTGSRKSTTTKPPWKP